ncbi:MAG: DUF1987 domain-containing protein [Flavobacteriales bacterium]|nr:DUF1987 domain-containing protein [Flavobacteriales bacterium]
MNQFHIPATRSTPEIFLDTENGVYRVVGHSIPENAGKFYTPVLEWLRENITLINTGSVFEFCLPYFNSSSLKALYMMLMEVKKESEKGKKFEVDWYIEDDDDFMTDAAETFTEMVGIKLNLRKGPIDTSSDKKVA